MTLLPGVIAQIVHAALMVLVAPVLAGLIDHIKARLVGRRGPPVLQIWRDLLKLLRKQPVLAHNASAVFVVAPVICLAAMIVAALLVPSFALGMITAPIADLLVIAGLFVLARTALALAAMDVGVAFGGIGASRALMFAVFAEPALILVFLVFALLAGTTNLNAIAHLLHDSAFGGAFGPRVSLGLALVATLAVALVQNARMPADNPATHLELSMVHDAMALEYSGRHLALLRAASCLNLLVWLDLILTLFAPFGLALADGSPLSWIVGLIAWVVKLGVLAVALAVFELSIARMRLFRVPEFLGIAVLLGLMAEIFLFVSQGFA